MYKLNKNISWAQKKECLVVYYNFNYYFFKGKSYSWIKEILSSRMRLRIKDIPQNFLDYLYKRKILI